MITVHGAIMKKNRNLFILILSILTFLLVNRGNLIAQSELDVIKGSWLHYSDAQNALYHHLAGQAYDMLDKRKQELAGLSTAADWQRYQQSRRKTFLDIVGPFPEKTPLNAQITRVVEKDSFRVEHIVFESQPGFYVTSSLFIPAGLKKKSKAPVVIYCSGHTEEGYRSAVYQHVIINLVKKGFIVFAFDPVGQGERLEYFDPATGKSAVGGPTKEHSYPGTQAFITGSSQAKFMIWDGIRAVDYLLTRKEVDPSRLGITGRSGGGTQSSYIAAMDERIYAAAPENYITNFKRLLQTIGPQDAEQNMFNAISKGIDHPDLLIVRAPKPAMMITTTCDMFSIQGARETQEEVSAIYLAFGRGNDFIMVEDDAPHASTKKNREAMYAFFQKHLINPGSSDDMTTTILTPEEIRVTPTGQVSTSYNFETVFSLNRKEAQKLNNELNIRRKDPAAYLPVAINSAKRLSGYIEPEENEEPIFTGRLQRDGYAIEKYFIKGEGDYVIPYLLMVPDKPNKRAVICLHPSGKSEAAHPGGNMEWFVKNGFTVLAPDLIGRGEMGPGVFRGDAYIEGDSHNLWYESILIGRSIAGVRTGDVIRLVKLLKNKPEVEDIYGVAMKESVPVLLHAAAFSSDISRLALIEPFSSYNSIVMNKFYKSSFISEAVPGALREYDLPDLASSLAPRKLLMAGVCDGNGNTEDSDCINKDIGIIRSAYQLKGSSGQFTVVPLKSGESPDAFFSDWIK
jgi:dienelactone hydrolase